MYSMEVETPFIKDYGSQDFWFISGQLPVWPRLRRSGDPWSKRILFTLTRIMIIWLTGKKWLQIGVCNCNSPLPVYFRLERHQWPFKFFANKKRKWSWYTTTNCRRGRLRRLASKYIAWAFWGFFMVSREMHSVGFHLSLMMHFSRIS